MVVFTVCIKLLCQVADSDTLNIFVSDSFILQVYLTNMDISLVLTLVDDSYLDI